MDFAQVGELGKGAAVTQGHKDDAVMGEGGERVEDSGFLTTTWGGRGDENTGILANKSTSAPELASGIPEGLGKRR